MDSFQITVLAIAVIILILIFTAIGILTKNSLSYKAYPPKTTTCPDFWSVDADGNCVIPPTSATLNAGSVYSGTTINLTNEKTDTSKIYTPGYISNGNKINYNDEAWGSMNKSSICAKRDWTNKLNIAWDGVSNYNSCE